MLCSSAQAALGKLNFYGTGDADRELLVARLSYTVSRAVAAVFNTSFTTFAAFMATAVSDLDPIAAFGIYSGLAILVNFLFTIFLHPAILVTYHDHFRGKPFCCSCLRRRRADDESALVGTAAAGDPVDDEEVTGHLRQNWEDKVFSHGYVPVMMASVSVPKPPSPCGKGKDDPKDVPELEGRDSEDPEAAEDDEGAESAERSAQLVPFRFVAWGGLLSLLALMSVMGFYASQLEAPQSRDEPFTGSHMFLGFLDDYTTLFAGGNTGVLVTVAWGIAGLDQAGTKRFNPNGYRGAVLLDEDFSMASREAQEYILQVCADLRTLSCIPAGNSAPLFGCAAGTAALAVVEVTCTLEEFIEWNAVNNPGDVDVLDLGEADEALWLQRLGEFSVAEGKAADTGLVGGEQKFFVIKYRSTLESRQPVAVKQPVIDLLYDFLDEVRDDAPEGLRSVFQVSFDMLWTNTELGIIVGMFQGLAISIPVAFLVLLFATSNVFLAVFAITGIIAIIASVLGTAFLLGFSLGIGESIAAVMVVGLRYVVCLFRLAIAVLVVTVADIIR